MIYDAIIKIWLLLQLNRETCLFVSLLFYFLLYIIELIEDIANRYLVNWFPYGNLVESVSLDFFCPFLAFHGRYHALTRRAREIGLVSHKQHNRWYLSAFSRMRYQKPRSRIVKCISCVFRINSWWSTRPVRNDKLDRRPSDLLFFPGRSFYNTRY